MKRSAEIAVEGSRLTLSSPRRGEPTVRLRA